MPSTTNPVPIFVYEYRTEPAVAGIHLVKQEDDLFTLCNRLALGWYEGDETLSGIAATCPVCRAVRGLPEE